MKGYYICKCGKEFIEPNKFNAHKSHCKVHLGEEKYNKRVLSDKKKLENIREEKIKNTAIKNKIKLDQWLSEKHICEKCGKIMTEKYTSGRFCSKSCANTNYRLPLFDRLSRSYKEQLERSKNIFTTNIVSRFYKMKMKKSKNILIDIPVVEKPKYDIGYPSRKRMSYAEKFWESILINNNIKYLREFKVLKNDHTPGCFKMDFLLLDFNIDLEIDGELHKNVVEKDQRRDILIESRGYKVYRIKWINPNSVNNKLLVKKQIDRLLNYLKNK